MPLADRILYAIAKRWPSPVAERVRRFQAEPGTEKYEIEYAWDQFDRKTRTGIPVAVRGLDVLEIGCGHGGGTCFIASCGARFVIGLDINKASLSFAAPLRSEVERQLNSVRLPIEFVEMDANHLGFRDESFDVVIADNAFEHFPEPIVVMKETHRVLRPGGRLIAPSFSSIYSKYGLHLKHGLKLPWANLFFSERTIVRALQRRAEDEPGLREVYPGLASYPLRVRDVRKHRDLNDLTHREFLGMAHDVGFRVDSFEVKSLLLGKILGKAPWVRQTRLMDVFSVGASAILRKRASELSVGPSLTVDHTRSHRLA